MNILNEIAAKTKERIQKEKLEIPEKDLIQMIQKRKVQILLHPEQQSITSRTPHSFYQALKKEGMSYICEVKKASPSKGLIAPAFPYLEIAKEYQEAGAAAVLLICAILNDEQLKEYRELAEELGMDALVEAHDEEEAERALKSGARIIGVNNRDLKTFQVDMQDSIRLRKLAPENVVFVSESGIKTSDDIQKLYDNQVDAVLIGETLMRSQDKKAALEELNGKPLK